MHNLIGGIYGYFGLFPLASGTDGAAFQRRLRELDRDRFGSPLSAVPIIQMARLALLDDAFFQSEPPKPDRMSGRYLIFLCNFDGADVGDLTRALAQAPPEVRDIWQGCLDCPDMTQVGALTGYFRKYQLDVTFYLSLQIDKPLREILRALQLTQLFTDFALGAQHRPRSLLRAAFLDFWKDYQNQPPPHPGSI